MFLFPNEYQTHLPAYVKIGRRRYLLENVALEGQFFTSVVYGMKCRFTGYEVVRSRKIAKGQPPLFAGGDAVAVVLKPADTYTMNYLISVYEGNKYA